MDSGSYLRGDEYDSVMNYPLNQKLITFFEDEKQTADDFMYGVNYCLSLYQKQCNEVMFNLLSSHDVNRITTRIKSKQKALELYAILLTMPGAPCVYYGDELLLDAPSRGTMPWNELLNNKEMTDFITFWLPVLLKNKLSICTFQSQEFFDHIPLNVSPKPDTLIRIFLTIKKIDSPIEIKEQKLQHHERKGFTVVEWGGSCF